MVQDSGFRVQGSGLRAQGSVSGVKEEGRTVQDEWSRVLEFRDFGLSNLGYEQRAWGFCSHSHRRRTPLLPPGQALLRPTTSTAAPQPQHPAPTRFRV